MLALARGKRNLWFRRTTVIRTALEFYLAFLRSVGNILGEKMRKAVMGFLHL